MQKKLKRKDRGRGRGGNKGSDGFHEVRGSNTVFPALLFRMTGCFALTGECLKIRICKIFFISSRKLLEFSHT